MSVYFDKSKNAYRFSFNQKINEKRVRASKLLPQGWTQTQAVEYDIKESARIVAEHTGIIKVEKLIEDAIAIYAEEKVPELKAKKDYMREYANMYYLYADKNMSALPEVCAEILKLTKTVTREGKKVHIPISNATKLNKIRYLTAACTYAYKFHGFGDINYAEKVRLPKVKNQRNNAPEREEVLRLARAMPRGPARSSVLVAFYTGMRQGEILRSDLRRGLLVADNTKNGQDKYIPVNPKINGHIKHFPTDMPWHILVNRFRSARKKLGLTHYRFHDIRHSAASEMLSAGVSLSIVGEVLGHKSPISTKRYAHLASQQRLEALLKIGTKKGQK